MLYGRYKGKLWFSICLKISIIISSFSFPISVLQTPLSPKNLLLIPLLLPQLHQLKTNLTKSQKQLNTKNVKHRVQNQFLHPRIRDPTFDRCSLLSTSMIDVFSMPQSPISLR